MELQVLAAPCWLWVGWNSLFPYWDLGLGLNQCSQYSMEPLPFPTPSKDEAMERWEGDYPKQMIKIEGGSFGNVTLAQGMPGREVLPFPHFGIFFHSFSFAVKASSSLHCPS